jgi:hypothetical protein
MPTSFKSHTFRYTLHQFKLVQTCLRLNDNRIPATYSAVRSEWPATDPECVLHFIESVQERRITEQAFEKPPTSTAAYLQ